MLAAEKGILALLTMWIDLCPFSNCSFMWIMGPNKSYFKFDNWWLGTDRFTDRVKGWWSSFVFTGKPDCILACNLKALKVKPKEWSKSYQGSLKAQKNNLLGQRTYMDPVLANRIDRGRNTNFSPNGL